MTLFLVSKKKLSGEIRGKVVLLETVSKESIMNGRGFLTQDGASES